MKNILSLFAIILLVTNISAQPKRPVSQPAPKPKAQAQPQAEKAEAEAVNNPINDFAKKGLPEAAILGGNPTPELAREVAGLISKYDEDSLPILMATLQKAGFYINDPNEKVLYQPVYDSIEMAFYDFEVAGMLKSSGLGMVTSVRKLANSLSENDTVFSADAIGQLILSDLRAALESKDPQAQFIAVLIFELGKNMPRPVDLKTATPETATLNIIQASLIERIMLRDLMKAYEASPQSSSFYTPDGLFRKDNRIVSFVNAGWRQPDGPCDTIKEISKLQKAGKIGAKTAENILHYLKLMKSIENVGAKKDSVSNPVSPKIEKGVLSKDAYKTYAEKMQHVNLALSYAKLIAAIMNVKAEFSLDGPPPLIRTQRNDRKEQKRTVTGKFTMDIPYTDLVNCLGKEVGAISNLKFSLPDGGVMKEKPVSWDITFIDDPFKKYTNEPVTALGINGKGIDRQVTDANGESKITLTGKPQPYNMEGGAVVPLPRKARLEASIATEKMDLSNDAQNIASVYVTDFGFDSGPLSLVKDVVAVAPEMISKMKLSSFAYAVPIVDWQPCTQDWAGVIYYRMEAKEDKQYLGNTLANGNTTGKGKQIFKYVEEAMITLNPRRAEEIDVKPPNPATIFISGERTGILEATRPKDPCCGDQEGSWETTYRSGSTGTFGEVQSLPFNIMYEQSGEDYFLGFNFSFSDVKLRGHNFHEVLSTNCPREHAYSKRESFEDNVSNSPQMFETRNKGTRVKSPAGEALTGEETISVPNAPTITWRWSLVRCNQGK